MATAHESVLRSGGPGVFKAVPFPFPLAVKAIVRSVCLPICICLSRENNRIHMLSLHSSVEPKQGFVYAKFTFSHQATSPVPLVAF